MTARLFTPTLALFLVTLVPAPAVAQTAESELRQEIEALKQGQQEIQKQLAEIKRLLQARPTAAAPSGADVKGKIFDLGENPVKGDPTARLTLVEFTDYQCPYCSRHATQTHPHIEKDYIATGKIRYSLLDLPLERIHPKAFKGAQVAHCAGEQGKYWEMHDRLFQHQKTLEPWNAHAEALELDVAKFEECLDGDKYAKAVRRDMAEARKAGATGTPSFVLGRSDPNDPTKVTGIAFLRGAQPYASFKSAIDRAFASLDAEAKEPPPETD
jgi:protein-disulfide isomerase